MRTLPSVPRSLPASDGDSRSAARSRAALLLSSPPLPKKWPERLAQRWPIGKRILAVNTAVDAADELKRDRVPTAHGGRAVVPVDGPSGPGPA